MWICDWGANRKFGPQAQSKSMSRFRSMLTQQNPTQSFKLQARAIQQHKMLQHMNKWTLSFHYFHVFSSYHVHISNAHNKTSYHVFSNYHVRKSEIEAPSMSLQPCSSWFQHHLQWIGRCNIQNQNRNTFDSHCRSELRREQGSRGFRYTIDWRRRQKSDLPMRWISGVNRYRIFFALLHFNPIFLFLLLFMTSVALNREWELKNKSEEFLSFDSWLLSCNCSLYEWWVVRNS